MIKTRKRIWHGCGRKTGLSNPWDSWGGRNPCYTWVQSRFLLSLRLDKPVFHPQLCKSLLILEVKMWSPHKQHTPSFSSYLISTTHWQCLTHKNTETWTNQRWKCFSFTNMIMKMHPLLVRYDALSKDSFSGVNQLQTDVYIAFTKTCVLSVELHVLDTQCMRALTNYEIRIC